MKLKIKPLCYLPILMVLTASIIFTGCGGGSDGDTGNNNQGTFMDQVNQLFPFSDNDPIDVVYICQRVNSNLLYYFDLNPDGSFRTYLTVDTGDDYFFDGTYDYSNKKIHLTSLNNILPLDETSDSITPQLGLIYKFTTPNMLCIAYGHEYDDVATDTASSYSCPEFSEGPASSQENAFEFIHRAFPFDLQVPGSTFRQRDRHVQSNNQPIVARGYGVYRRAGDNFYAYFADQFDDYQIVSGSFLGNGQQIEVDQLPSGSNRCNHR